MFLCHVHVENFRGLRKLDLDFDDTTILIGENAVGKTSVLEILSICLGLHNSDGEFLFEESDFFVAGPSGPENGFPIRVVLTFREREEDEWDSLDRLVTAFVDGPDNLRHLSVRIEAVPADGDTDVSWEFLDLEGQPLKRQPGVETFQHLRELSPFVLIRADRYFTSRRQSDDPRTTPIARRRRQPELELVT
jgi:putative ATP-dependent endonuclease of OLD family